MTLTCGLDNNEHLLETLELRIPSVKVVLYKLNQSFSIPYFEFVLEKDSFPVCPLDDITPPTSSQNANQNLQMTRQIRDKIFNYIETKIFSYHDIQEHLPQFKGFYKADDYSWYVFYDVTLSQQPFVSPNLSQWKVLYQTPDSFQSLNFFQIYQEKADRIKEIKIRPIWVYGTNNQYLRQERDWFGYSFYFKLKSELEFTFPHLLFLPPTNKIFHLQKNELQTISPDILKTYDFADELCIQYVENKNTTWCIKNILSFFPVETETAKEGKTAEGEETAEEDGEKSRQELTKKKESFVFGNPWAKN